MKKPLCLCGTCRKPLPPDLFKIDARGVRHDNCIYCEADEAQVARFKRLEARRAYERKYYAKKRLDFLLKQKGQS